MYSIEQKITVISEDVMSDVTNQRVESLFKLVPASLLTLEDDWLKYQPKTIAEMKFKNMVEDAIKSGIKDFWRPVCDPSFDDNGCICYEPGKKPAVGKSYNWWKENAKNFCPERGSRLGTKFEYVAFQAVLIKELVASGKSLSWAWNAVCSDSFALGHYWNSENAKYAFENTGSREICGWYDLANSNKILMEDQEADVFWFAGGCYGNFSSFNSLTNLYHCYKCNEDNSISCGWLVLPEGNTVH